MEAFIVEWLSLLGRWVHIITGIAWIGASFYFVFLDRSLLPPKSKADSEKGVGGEIWSVHGGGFYHAQKYVVAPDKLPEILHWFKWEAYTTWISGFFLFMLLYGYSAEIYLIDPNVAALSKSSAILMSLGFITGGWIVYDFLCKSNIGKNEQLLGFLMFVLVSAVAIILGQIFSGRGAYMLFGVMLGTIMVANVFFVIIPGQKDLVKAKEEGRDPDPIHGIRGKQRSVHNTYFTLPVLFVMISNHYAMTYGHEYNWLILIVISLAGALIRIYFVSRHGEGKPLVLALVGGLSLLFVTSIFMALAMVKSAGSPVSMVSIDQVENIIQQRCIQCHSVNPSQPGFNSAPLGIVYDSTADIENQAQRIYQQAVVSKVMPIGNLTGMTDTERQSINDWFHSTNQ
jgi:uncharacterized membrane protein